MHEKYENRHATYLGLTHANKEFVQRVTIKQNKQIMQ